MSSIQDALLAEIASSKPAIAAEVGIPTTENVADPAIIESANVPAPASEGIVPGAVEGPAAVDLVVEEKTNVQMSTQVINEIQTILLDFKSHLPAFEIMQATNPDAYESLTKIIMVMISMSQIMIEAGQLKDTPPPAVQPGMPGAPGVNPNPTTIDATHGPTASPIAPPQNGANNFPVNVRTNV